MRDEKEERKKQARSNKHVHDMDRHVLMKEGRRKEEGRKKEASKVKQITRQSNTAHRRQSLFLRKMSCLRWDSNPRHSIL